MRALLPALLSLASCTLATDATDRRVSASIGRDLSYTFTGMNAHAGTPLDVVVAEQLEAGSVKRFRLRAHARIVLPPDSGDAYPDQPLYLENVMAGSATHLLFYADSNADDRIESGITSGVPGGEHIWIEAVPESGIGEFAHAFNFQEYSRNDYSLSTGDVVLAITNPAADWRPPPCGGEERVLEVAITLAPGVNDQQRGYYRNVSSNPAPQASVRLDDIVDANSNFGFVVSIDGTVVKSFALKAPAGGEFVVEQALWYPTPAEAPACP
jgi:hypothetical protein